MSKLNTGLKITLTVVAIALAIGAIAVPIILFTNANSDTNPMPSDNSSQITNQDAPISNSTSPEPVEDSETPTEEELLAKRDQQRRRDMASLKAAVNQFQANNNGRLPGHGSNLDGQGELVYQPTQGRALPSTSDGIAAKLIAYYLNPAGTSENSFIDPDGWAYGLTIIDYDHYKNLPEKYATHMVYLLHQTRCDTTTGITKADKPRDFAVVYKLETSNTHYCIDSK